MKLDEIHKLIPSVVKEIEQGEYDEDTVLDLLIMSYAFGHDNANEMLDLDNEVDSEKMLASIYKDIAGEDYTERLEKSLKNDFDGLQRLLETEVTRNYNQAIFDCAIESGLYPKKRWETVLDDRVRDTHDYLEGVEVGLEEPFFTYDGDSAMFPCDFSLASNNVNCRCSIRLLK